MAVIESPHSRKDAYTGPRLTPPTGRQEEEEEGAAGYNQRRVSPVTRLRSSTEVKKRTILSVCMLKTSLISENMKRLYLRTCLPIASLTISKPNKLNYSEFWPEITKTYMH